MRATFKQPRTKPAEGAVGTKVSRQRRSRHQDQLERQAHLAARRVASGEVNVVRALGTTEPASGTVKESIGEPLPQVVREGLESSFGAQLEAIRVHRDAAAAAAARILDASAFTTGSHIFFGLGSYDPSTVSGQELLAHEVAHALQQTGRRSSDGRMRASERTGRGDIQRADGMEGEGIVGAVSFAGLERTHREATSDPAVGAFIARMDERLNGTLALNPDSEVARQLQDEVVSGGFDTEPPAARAFLFDCLKRMKLHAGALHLLEGDRTLRTAFHSRPFWEFSLAEKGLSWFAEALDQHPELSKLWPRRYFDSIRSYLLGPTRAIPALSETFADQYMEVLRNAGDITSLGENEWGVGGWALLKEADDARLSVLRRVRDAQVRAMGQSGTPVGRQLLAFALAAEARKAREAPVPSAAAGVEDLVHRIAEQVEVLAAEVFQFWTDVVSSRAVEFAGGAEASAGVDPVGARRIPRHASFGRLNRLLLRASTRLFVLTPIGELPAAEQHAEALRAVQAELSAFAQKYLELPLIEAFRKKKVDQNLAFGFGWFLNWTHRFIELLKSYDQAEDQQQENAYHRSDVRLAHRIQIAAELSALAAPLGWQDLGASAAAVLNALRERRTTLALAGAWEQRPATTFDAMERECGALTRVHLPGAGGAAGPLSPFVVRDLINFYGAEYLRILSEALEAILASEAKTPVPGVEPAVNRALRETADAPRPMKWINPKAVAARFEGDPRSLNDLIEEHPKTQELLHRELDRTYGLFVFPPTHEAAVAIWLVPTIEPFIRSLRGIPELNTVLLRAGKDPHAPNLEWLAALTQVKPPAGGLRPSEIIAARERAAYEAQYTRIQPLLRQATTLERRRLAITIRAALERYKDRIVNYEIPRDVLFLMERFFRGVSPAGDEAAQIAALTLSVADVLHAKLRHEESYDLVHPLLGFLRNALRHIEGGRLSLLKAVLHEDEPLEGLLANREKAAAMVATFEAVAAKVQERFGFTVRGTGSGRVLMSLVYPDPIPMGQPFEVDGDTYEIVAVHETFTYHPAYGLRPGKGEEGKESGYSPPILKDGTGHKMSPSDRKLVTFTRNGVEITITARLGGRGEEYTEDEARLDLLSHVVETEALVIRLERSAELIEAAVNLQMEVIELIPGAGQALMVARITTSVAHFLASGEFENIKNLLVSDPSKLIDEIVAKLNSEVLRPETLWRFLVLTVMKDPLAVLRKLGGRTGRETRLRPSARNTLGKIIALIKGIGTRIADALAALKDRFRGPLEGFQGFVVSRPQLAFALEMVATYADILREIVGEVADIAHEITEGIVEAQDQFANRLRGFLTGLQGLELPRQILPPALLVRAVAEIVKGRLGLKAKAAWGVLDTIGALNSVYDMIGKELEKVGPGPNEFWQKRLIPAIEHDFKTARDDLVAGIYGLLREVPALSTLALPGELPEVTVEQTEESPEAAPYGSMDLGAVPRRLPAVTGGRPLGNVLRARGERHFGHDLGHVRLHTGSETAPFTSALGAEALTTGSHVYLRPGLSPWTTHGSRILGHELTHVLQQTGPRSLGHEQDSRPMVGQPGKGIRVDPVAEAVAARVASTDLGERTTAADVGARVEGPQPAMDLAVVREMIHTFAAFESGRRLQETLERRVVGKVPWAESGRKIWRDTVRLLENEKNYAKFLSSVAPLVRTQVLAFESDIAKTIPAITADAWKRKKGAPKPPTGSGKEVPKELNGDRFAQILEGYLFTKTGVGIDIDLRPGSEDEVGRVRVHYLHLAVVPGDSKLWDAVTKSGLAEDDAPIVRVRLQALGPNPFIWDRSSYRFSRRFIDDFKTLKAERWEEVLKKPFPTPEVYTNIKTYEPTIALRVGTYGESGQHGIIDRESHHTSQFLLVKYFRNKHEKFKPFRSWDYDGLEPEGGGGGETASFKAPGEKAVSFEALDQGERGNPMPAILLARETHGRGRVHIFAEPDWKSEVPGTRSQARRLDRQFWEALSPDLQQIKDKPPAESAPRFESHKKKHGKTAVQKEIYGAIQGTYQWMHREMMASLKQALHVQETAYYHGLAARDGGRLEGGRTGRLKPEWTIKSTTMDSVWRAAEKNDRDVMSKFGWKVSTS